VRSRNEILKGTREINGKRREMREVRETGGKEGGDYALVYPIYL